MTFTQLVAEVMDRLNLTSTDAQTRIGQRINQRYRKVTSSLGLLTSRREITTFTLNSGVDADLPDYTLTDVEKVVRITQRADSGGVRVLKEVTYDDVTNSSVRSGLPHCWAVKEMGDDYVTITLDAFPDAEDFDLSIEHYSNLSDLSGTDVPIFAKDFHDILVEGALSDEYRKLEKFEAANDAENRFNARLSDLRMFIAKSAYLDIQQGRDNLRQSWRGRSWWNYWNY